MTLHDTLDSLDRLIQSRSILEHPFYVAWRRGELSRDQLATYARVYYPHVAAFPGYLRAALDVASAPIVRDELARNLADELSNPKPHPELWLDFAEDLGLDRAAVAGAEPRPAARRIVATFDRLARGESAGALAALYAYESQQPEVASQKADGLRRYYGVERAEALAYFEVHAVADREHRRGERRALEHALAGGTVSPDVVPEAAGEALDAYWGLLDGVCQDAAIPVMA
jgi:pyrroloquinoline-quinone synthase